MGHPVLPNLKYSLFCIELCIPGRGLQTFCEAVVYLTEPQDLKSVRRQVIIGDTLKINSRSTDMQDDSKLWLGFSWPVIFKLEIIK
jgi:hypothetical protein